MTRFDQEVGRLPDSNKHGFRDNNKALKVRIILNYIVVYKIPNVGHKPGTTTRFAANAVDCTTS